MTGPILPSITHPARAPSTRSRDMHIPRDSGTASSSGSQPMAAATKASVGTLATARVALP